MIPIRNTISSKNYPIVNNTLICLNIVVYIIELLQGINIEQFAYIYGLVPARYTVSSIAYYFSIDHLLFSFLSFMFLHGSFWHLISNMWSLYIFGDNVEERLGSIRYLLFYILCGVLSGIVHLVFNLYSNTPIIGASGAIAGVMGAYLLLYPGAKILTFIPIIIIPYFIEIPAFLFLGFWFVLQFFNAVGSNGNISNIAWWAHVGGFVFGIILLKILLLLPSDKMSGAVKKITTRKKTNRLQVINPIVKEYDPNLYGVLHITRHEAISGTKKFVNIPWGFHKRLYNINIPPGISESNLLRLKGLGRQMPDGQTGYLILKVKFEQQFISKDHKQYK